MIQRRLLLSCFMFLAVVMTGCASNTGTTSTSTSTTDDTSSSSAAAAKIVQVDNNPDLTMEITWTSATDEDDPIVEFEIMVKRPGSSSFETIANLDNTSLRNYQDPTFTFNSGFGTYVFRIRSLLESGTLLTSASKSFNFQGYKTYSTQWSTFSPQGNHTATFNNPKGLFLDDSLSVVLTPRLFLADSLNHRVLEFRADNATLQQSRPSTQPQDSEGTPIGSSETGEYNTPTSITIDSSQRIWIADSANERIYVINRLDPTETTTFEGGGFNTSSPTIGQFGDVQAVAARNNTIYVADNYASTHRVQKLVISESWEISGSSIILSHSGYSFTYVADIATYSDGTNTYVYALDKTQGKVVYFRNDVYQGSWGGIGSGNGLFSSPEGLTVGADARVYVADTGNHRIQVFSLTGTFVDKWGIEGSDPGEFSYPTDIVVGSDGTTYVSERGNARIQVFIDD